MIEIIQYPDYTSYPKVNLNESTIVYNLYTYQDLWNLGQILETYNHNNITPTVIIPWLIDGQADRRFTEDSSHNLKLVCKFLNSFKVEKYVIYHPHNPEVVEALLNNVKIIDNSQFINAVINSLNWRNIIDDKGIRHDYNSILMSADAGGFKSLMKLCDTIKWQGETISASKSRVWNGKESVLIQSVPVEDFKGKDILIVDDICIYGGTFKGLSKLLRERNCGKLYLAVSHMTVHSLQTDSISNYFD
jgi:ribose-phosphate pyrophosphokinase